MDKSILLVLNMQEFFVNKNMLYPHIEGSVYELMRSHVFDIVIGIGFREFKNTQYSKYLGWNVSAYGYSLDFAKGYERHFDYTLYRNNYDVVDKDLLSLLSMLNDGRFPDKVFICGMDITGSVIVTASSLFEFGIRPVVLSAFCASAKGSRYYEYGLNVLKELIGEHQVRSVKTIDSSMKLLNM